MTSVRESLTPFYRLDNDNGWQITAISNAVIVDPLSGKLRLGKRGDFAIPLNEPAGSFGGLTLPRGVAHSEDGRIFLIDPNNNQILYYDTSLANREKKQDDVFWPFKPLWIAQTHSPIDEHEAIISTSPPTPGPYELNSPQDLTLSPSGELCVADSGNNRVLIYSWPDLRLRQEINIAGTPSALTYDNEKRLCISDSDNGRVWRYSRYWKLDHHYLGGTSSDEGTQLSSPTALAIDQNSNELIVLDGKNIVVLNEEGIGEAIDIRDSDIFRRTFIPPFFLKGGELNYPQINKPRCEALHLVGIDVGRSGLLANRLPLIVISRSLRLPRSGIFYTQEFDNTTSASQWHRIVLDMDLPSTAKILVQTYTSDRATEDSEINNITWSEPFVISTDRESQLPELLIQSGAGRFLRVRIELLGDGKSSPEISAIQIFGPRESTLKYLPPPFHQDPESAYFLDRFLSYFDTVYQEITFQIEDFTRYLDPFGAPGGEFLEWLGSWFDWTFLAQWPDNLRREMIAQSIQHFKQRGTLTGLQQMLLWHTGEQSQIIEHFRLRNYRDKQQSDDNDFNANDLFIGELPLAPSADQMTHWFTVILPVSAIPNDEAQQQIQRLIRAQKPAHTEFQIRTFSPGVRVGKQSSIGIDMWIGHYPQQALGHLGSGLGSLNLGQSAALARQTSKAFKIGHQLLN